jgi:hypothetical protein
MRLLVVLLGGAVFGFGLALSTMTRQEVVLSFLRLTDLGLLLVMAGGVAVTTLAFRLAPRLRPKPPLAAAYEPLRDRLDRRTIAGAAIFGLGWGISGICPGSAIASLGTGNWPVALALLGMLLGASVKEALFPDSPAVERRETAESLPGHA